MESSEHRPSDGDRRCSTRRSFSLSNDTHGSHTDDSYDLTDFSVADGFRPTDSSSHTPTPPQSLLQPPSLSNARSGSPSPSQASSSSSRPQDTSQPQLAPPIAEFPQQNTRSRPSSISKSHRAHESLTLRNDGSNAANPTSLGRPQLPTLSTGVPLARNASGQEMSGPSHPYHAYPQRTMSVTSSSTGAPVREGEYSGPRGPTHPYSLYPQNTVPVEENHDHAIPVGFAGMGGTYQRQIGPDGEESGDLVGPLGHMEELPPYTRYPEPAHLRNLNPEGAPAASPAATTSTPTDNGATPQSPNIPGGAGGIGMATRNPEYSSTEENLSVAQSGRSGETSENSRQINTAAQDYAEKLPTGKWQRRARKKLWGIIPYWAICLLVFGLVIVGVVMGAVLGMVLADDDKPKKDPDESGASIGPLPTTAWDVDPLPTLPPNLAPLAVGLYDLPPLDASQAPRSCFNDTTQAQAWSCEMPFRYYSMEVNHRANASAVNDYEITLEAINGSDAIYVWGTQPPSFSEPQALTLVNDSFETGRGPAWWSKIDYDKEVVVSESSFSANAKRDWKYTAAPDTTFDPARFLKKNPGPVDGEKPWICTWPNVTMEIFIYPSQNASLSLLTSTTESASAPTNTADLKDSGRAPYDPTPAYPQVVKFVERRLYQDNDETAATCRQVKIINDGKDSVPVLDDDNNPVEVQVTEKTSSYEELLEQQQRSRHPDRRWEDEEGEDEDEDEKKKEEEAYEAMLLPRETLELTDCGCLWWST